MSILRKFAKGQTCTIRIPMVCNSDPETTVLAHMGGGGMGLKQPDLLGAHSCSDCHDVVDGRVRTAYSHDECELMHWQGVGRTIRRVEAAGMISISKL